MSKVLYLPLKKEWYEMIESGVKTEEYREIVPYWCVRLLRSVIGVEPFIHHPSPFISHGKTFKEFDAVKFSYGYTKRTMTFECKGITIGKGKKEWGAPDNDIFIIKLGERIE